MIGDDRPSNLGDKTAKKKTATAAKQMAGWLGQHSCWPAIILWIRHSAKLVFVPG